MTPIFGFSGALPARVGGTPTLGGLIPAGPSPLPRGGGEKPDSVPQQTRHLVPRRGGGGLGRARKFAQCVRSRPVPCPCVEEKRRRYDAGGRWEGNGIGLEGGQTRRRGLACISHFADSADSRSWILPFRAVWGFGVMAESGRDCTYDCCMNRPTKRPPL